MRALLGIILGGMAGIIGGLLWAPRSGAETREKVMKHLKKESCCCCCETPAE